MLERLQKVIAGAYGVSRRAAEQLIIDGKVKINGRVAQIGISADSKTDKIEVEGKRLGHTPKPVYIILNKPRGYVTTMADEKGRKSVKDLMKDINCRVFPVGRLDMDSEGVLLMTNDGEWANNISHPSRHIEKTYVVSVVGDASAAVKKMSQGMDILDENGVLEFTAAPARVTIVNQFENNTQISVTISEGHNRQVRKMCEQSGLEVKRLIRTAVGGLVLSGVKTGKWRFLTEDEVKNITRIRKGDKKTNGRQH